MVFNDLNINKLLLILAKDSLPYQSSEEMEKIKDFKIYFLDDFAEGNNIMGKYYFSGHRIKIFGTPKLSRNYILRTPIHEFAHHINYVIQGGTDHDEKFFDEFTRLLHSALDFDLLDVEELLSDTFTKDRHRVKAMVNSWKNKNPGKYFLIRQDYPEFFVDEKKFFFCFK